MVLYLSIYRHHGMQLVRKVQNSIIFQRHVVSVIIVLEGIIRIVRLSDSHRCVLIFRHVNCNHRRNFIRGGGVKTFSDYIYRVAVNVRKNMRYSSTFYIAEVLHIVALKSLTYVLCSLNTQCSYRSTENSSKEKFNSA